MFLSPFDNKMSFTKTFDFNEQLECFLLPHSFAVTFLVKENRAPFQESKVRWSVEKRDICYRISKIIRQCVLLRGGR